MTNRDIGALTAPLPAAPPTAAAARRETAIGLASALGGFLIWGMVPLYFKLLAALGPLEILAHRVVWTVVLLGGLVVALGRVRDFVLVLFSRRIWIYLITTALVSTNWLLFIWAVVNDHVLESSLGYYINPLVNVLLGVAFLGERLNRRQVAAVLLAAAAVGTLVVGYGAVPWVALSLAFSFGFYAMVRKKARIDPLLGLVVETALLTPLALLYLIALGVQDTGAFGAGWAMTLLLSAAGVATGAPLLLFMHGAQRLKLSTIGLLQYLSPTLQFILAVAVFGEPFTNAHLVSFALIWTGLGVFSWDALAGSAGGRRKRRVRRKLKIVRDLTGWVAPASRKAE